MRELDKDGKLNGDVIDGILSQEKKEVDKVIINSAELEKYFGKDKSPREMKDKIISLLDDWKPSSRPSWASPKRKRNLKSDLGTFCPEVFRFPEWLLWLYPPSPPVFQHGRERAVKGASHRCFQRPALDRLSRLCFFSDKRRGYILQSRPLSQDWERAWGLG